MITIDRVEFGGFLGYRERQAVDLADRGLTLISGENRDATGADSNGAGKTTIFDAILWTLYGETTTGEKTDEVIHVGGKRAKGVLWLTDSRTGLEHRIERRRTKSGGSLKFFQMDPDDPSGEEIERTGATMSDTQARVEEVVGLDVEAFRACILFGQGAVKRFASASTTDGERKRILRSLLRLEKFEDARKHASAKARELEDELTIADAEAKAARREEATALSDLDEAKRKRAGWADEVEDRVAKRQARVDNWQDELGDIDLPDKEVEDLGARLAELDIKLSGWDALSDAADAASDEHAAAQAETRKRERLVAGAESRAKGAAEELDRLEELAADGVCAHCGSLLDDENVHYSEEEGRRRAEVDKAKADLETARAALEVAAAEEKDAKDAAAAAEAEVRAMADVEAEASRIQRRLTELERLTDRANDLKDRITREGEAIDEERARPNPHEDAVAKLKTRVLGAKRRAGRVEAETAGLRESLKIAGFWQRAFGHRGVQSFAIDFILPRLERATQDYLAVLADGDITVRFDTVSKLKKKGETRDKFAIEAEVGGIAGVKLSGGQRTRLELATSFALADLVAEREDAALDCYFLDEAFDGLDPVGKDRLLGLLRLLRARRSTILAVTHDPDVARHFGREVRVVREGGASRVEEGGA